MDIHQHNNLPIIDTHFHLPEMDRKHKDSTELMQRDISQGLIGGMEIGITLDNTDLRRKRIAELPGFGYSIGLYPDYAKHDDIDIHLENLKSELETRREDSLLWAIGEAGIDYHWNYGTPEKQEQLFDGQLFLAETMDMPLVIHNREADDAILRCVGRRNVRLIFHCFSSGPQALKSALYTGAFISFAGNLTFKNAVEIQEAARIVPLDRVIFETDSPYLTPVPRRGRPNHPGNVRHVYEFFSELRGIPLPDLAQQVQENVIRAIPRCEAVLS